MGPCRLLPLVLRAAREPAAGLLYPTRLMLVAALGVMEPRPAPAMTLDTRWGDRGEGCGVPSCVARAGRAGRPRRWRGCVGVEDEPLMPAAAPVVAWPGRRNRPLLEDMAWEGLEEGVTTVLSQFQARACCGGSRKVLAMKVERCSAVGCAGVQLVRHLWAARKGALRLKSIKCAYRRCRMVKLWSRCTWSAMHGNCERCQA